MIFYDRYTELVFEGGSFHDFFRRIWPFHTYFKIIALVAKKETVKNY